MFGWLFGKKKKQEWEIPEKLYGYDELAAEFFAMWPADQHVALRTIRCHKPAVILESARPVQAVKSLSEWKLENQSPMSAERFILELRHLLEAKRKDRVTAVFQQIFRDRSEVETYVRELEEYHKSHGASGYRL